MCVCVYITYVVLVISLSVSLRVVCVCQRVCLVLRCQGQPTANTGASVLTIS